MDNYQKIYWLTRLDIINSIFSILCFVCIAAIYFHYATDVKNKILKRISIILLILSIIIVTFLPTKKDMIIIWAGGKTLDFVEKDSSLNKIPGQTTAIISNYLDKSIKELEK